MDFPISLEVQTYLRIRKAVRALPILALTSASVYPLWMWRPILADVISRHVVLSCICAWLWDRSTRSLAKSRSSSRYSYDDTDIHSRSLASKKPRTFMLILSQSFQSIEILSFAKLSVNIHIVWCGVEVFGFVEAQSCSEWHDWWSKKTMSPLSQECGTIWMATIAWSSQTCLVHYLREAWW